jgi:hypothetical protein
MNQLCRHTLTPEIARSNAKYFPTRLAGDTGWQWNIRIDRPEVIAWTVFNVNSGNVLQNNHVTLAHR